MKRVGKVINIDNEGNDITVLIKDNNQTVHYPLSSVNYSSMINDTVEVIQDGDGVIIGSYKEESLSLENGQKKVNKLVYILLALFLGGLGAHKFYSGKIMLGIIYLIFCWTFIPSVIGLIEAIMVAGKQVDKNGDIII